VVVAAQHLSIRAARVLDGAQGDCTALRPAQAEMDKLTAELVIAQRRGSNWPPMKSATDLCPFPQIGQNFWKTTVTGGFRTEKEETFPVAQESAVRQNGQA
jgi:hypothetical protein